MQPVTCADGTSTLLLDVRRAASDSQPRPSAAKKARFAAYDHKRKVLVTELEERERAFMKSRFEQEKQWAREMARTIA
jgi:DnaJ family protein C protein 17